MKLDKEIKEKRPELANRKGVIYHQDNARPHTFLVSRKKWFFVLEFCYGLAEVHFRSNFGHRNSIDGIMTWLR